MRTIYFKNVLIAHFTVGGKCWQLSNILNWIEVQQPTQKSFKKYDYAKVDYQSNLVFLYKYFCVNNPEKRKKGMTRRLALDTVYKIGSTNYMIDAEIIENRTSIPFQINQFQSIKQQINISKNM